MKKWKAEIWMEDAPERGERYLTQAEINSMMKATKETIENTFDDFLKVVQMDVNEDKESEQ